MIKLIKFVFILFLGVISCACVNRMAVQELNKIANEYIENGDIQAATSRLEASVDLDGNIYESRYNLANLYLQAGKYKQALEQIEVATELADKEPAVFYTHGVAALRVANEVYEKKNKDGVLEPVIYKDEQGQLGAAKYYVKLLSDSNKSFDKYTKLAPNAEDTQDIIRLMAENKEKLTQKAQEFKIEIIE